MENAATIMIAFHDVNEPRWETFWSTEEAYKIAGLPISDDDEVQAFRLACAQSTICNFARKNDNFVALREGMGQNKKYGYTKNELLKVNDTIERTERAENQIDDASDRAIRMVKEYPHRESELRVEIPKKKIILIKKETGKIKLTKK